MMIMMLSCFWGKLDGSPPQSSPNSSSSSYCLNSLETFGGINNEEDFGTSANICGDLCLPVAPKLVAKKRFQFYNETLWPDSERLKGMVKSCSDKTANQVDIILGVNATEMSFDFSDVFIDIFVHHVTCRTTTHPMSTAAQAVHRLVDITPTLIENCIHVYNEMEHTTTPSDPG